MVIPLRDVLRHLDDRMDRLVECRLDAFERRLEDDFRDGECDVDLEERRLLGDMDVVTELAALKTAADGVQRQSRTCAGKKKQ